MFIFSFIAIIFLIIRLRKTLKFSPAIFKWKSWFSVGTWASIGISIALISYLDDDMQMIIGAAALIAVINFTEREPDFAPLKSYIRANYFLAAATLLCGLVDLIAPVFYDSHEGIAAILIVGCFVWISARWATTKKQQEELRIFGQRNAELDRLVAERTAELTKQRNELQGTLELLQTTQQQLIQSEKLASLGELTAGIAHEIQNPLNFVNNFSEVSMELIEEMEEELAKGDTEEVIAIANDIKQNLEKIRHHGQRADGIVKGMLQHSRASSTTKEPTDINKLADEYLRLSYHGLRAKDKSFNAHLESHLAEGLPLANMVPQDVGRVLLNLFNNAFYAVHQKQKKLGGDFKPTVEVDTSVKGKNIEIRVKDNGIGIPDEVKEKIMQPFFTTKPTGEGTGLGLSLSYDIIVKGHGGKINVNTKEGEFTEFIITLPV